MENCDDSWLARPNNFTSRAPDTDNVSCIMPVIDAWATICSRRTSRSRLPTWRDAMMKRGRIDTASRVSLHSSCTMIRRVAATAKMFETSVTKVELTACWAPTTSEFNRDISSPVLVFVKNPSDMAWRWL